MHTDRDGTLPWPLSVLHGNYQAKSKQDRAVFILPTVQYGVRSRGWIFTLPAEVPTEYAPTPDYEVNSQHHDNALLFTWLG